MDPYNILSSSVLNLNPNPGYPGPILNIALVEVLKEVIKHLVVELNAFEQLIVAVGDGNIKVGARIGLGLSLIHI